MHYEDIFIIKYLKCTKPRQLKSLIAQQLGAQQCLGTNIDKLHILVWSKTAFDKLNHQLNRKQQSYARKNMNKNTDF